MPSRTRALSNLIAQRPTLGLLARILRENGRAYLPRYAVAFVFMFIFAGATALSAFMMRDVINKVFVDRDPAALAWIPGAILAIFAVKASPRISRRSRSRTSATASSPRPRSACSITCCA